MFDAYGFLNLEMINDRNFPRRSEGFGHSQRKNLIQPGTGRELADFKLELPPEIFLIFHN